MSNNKANPLDRCADAGMLHTEGSDSIHETAPQGTSGLAGSNNNGPPIFNKDVAVGKMFKADGAIGGTADKIGGPLAKDGAIGKNFNETGNIGGTVQETLGKK